MEQQLENLTASEEAETEDDSHLLVADQFRKHPLNLNNADADDLRELNLLSGLQIDNLLSYRTLLGKLISIYELQAVPSWDLPLIRKILPYITIGPAVSLQEDIRTRLRNGEHSLLFRISQVIEKSAAYNKSDTGTKYLGSPQRIFFRYRYNYKNLLQFGLVADKDAGEQFGNSAAAGFDFYSFHLFFRKIGIIQSLAVGDFAVNMGQGLMQWQGLAFKKSVELMSAKRQSAILRPYTSAGEFNFSRGLGITVKRNRLEATVFASFRKIGASLEQAGETTISSFLASGFHRTLTEIDNRNNIRQLSSGAVLYYKGSGWHVAVNAVAYQFSLSVQKRDEPYNLFALKGKRWYNLSIDYSYTYKNIHLFGEAAVDKGLNPAFINGVLISVDSRVDLALVQRTIAKTYQAVYGNAFTENVAPSNESGLYAGLVFRPADNWRIDSYVDVYKFPWLKYLVDAPSYGRDYLVQITHTLGKKGEIYSRFKSERRQGNQPDNLTPLNFLVELPRQNWRIHLSYKINSSLTWRQRAEIGWYDKKGQNAGDGFLLYTDILYKPVSARYSVVARLQYFDTDDYNARVYAYENDVLYGYSIPAFFDKGWRYYMTISLDIKKNLCCWIRCAQSIYLNKKSIGSGADEIEGDRKSELKFQLQYIF
jgi:hypothetical protein